MAYEYKMMNLSLKNQDPAQYLQEQANQMAAQGWEFYQVNDIDVLSSPGCLASLLGGKQTVLSYSVAIYRRQK
jgi:hypothetical protein